MYLSHLKLSDCFRHLLLHLYPDNKIEFMFNFGEISMDFNEFFRCSVGHRILKIYKTYLNHIFFTVFFSFWYFANFCLISFINLMAKNTQAEIRIGRLVVFLHHFAANILQPINVIDLNSSSTKCFFFNILPLNLFQLKYSSIRIYIRLRNHRSSRKGLTA